MDTDMLFSTGLSLHRSWEVVKGRFIMPAESSVQELHLKTGFERGVCFLSSRPCISGGPTLVFK